MAAPWWSSEPRNTNIACVVIGAVFVVFGAVSTWQWLRYLRPEQSPVMEVLRDRPGELVWIYQQQVAVQGQGVTAARVYNILLRLRSGKSFNLNVARSDRDQLLELLGELAPQATFGYSRELAKQYRRDPASLASATS